ncbi:MAG TPA: DUF1343 domain-containing protein [Alteromonas australica]|nr:DUF1343 domain-containing protein [Alteromonas australica]
MVVNQSAVVPDSENAEEYVHLVDTLLNKQVNIISIMSPEHSFRGDKGAGVTISDERDPITHIPIYSLYGHNKKPTSAMLKNVDLIVFDLQDVGVRFYTYLSTLHYVMEAAAEHDIPVMVLDRPNPNGQYVDGPVLDLNYRSFVGMHPIPVLHGMTLGELALMIKGEGWIENADQLQLTIIPVRHYHKQKAYRLPVPPSPNLPNDTAVSLYPTLCLFEGTDVSIGRGTPLPFQIIGHPDVALGKDSINVSSSTAALNPKHNNATLRIQKLSAEDALGLSPTWWVRSYNAFQQTHTPFFTRPQFFDKLAGTSLLRQQIKDGFTGEQIKASWQADLAAFKKQRAPYLLY